MAAKRTKGEALDLVLKALEKDSKGVSQLERVYLLDAIAEHVAMSLRGISRASIDARLSAQGGGSDDE